MQYKKMTGTPQEQAETENMKATVEKQKEKIENQKLLIQYRAERNDIYIPEDEEEEHVQDFAENEENV